MSNLSVDNLLNGRISFLITETDILARFDGSEGKNVFKEKCRKRSANKFDLASYQCYALQLVRTNSE